MAALGSWDGPPVRLSLSFGRASLLLLQNHLYLLVSTGFGFGGVPESCLLELGDEALEQHLSEHGIALQPLPSPASTTTSFRFFIRNRSFLSASCSTSSATRWAHLMMLLPSLLGSSDTSPLRSRRQHELPVMALVWMKVASWWGRWVRTWWQGQPCPKGPQRDLVPIPCDEEMWQM